MDEARQQAYLNLIQQLLSCPNDEEINNILQANQELIDRDFLQVMERYAERLEAQKQGNNNAVQLRNLVQHLTYDGFLQEVLQAERESQERENNDTTTVYRILKRHQDKLDNIFAQLLQKYARYHFSHKYVEQIVAAMMQDRFSQEKTEQVPAFEGVEEIVNTTTKLSTAGIIGSLCTKIAQFPLGSKANNVEIAITGYQTILEVEIREIFPEGWANIQYNLGNAYLDRIRGERTENVELAIAALQQSLKVSTREAFPEQWAETQMCLGCAYSNRIRGERAENIELAIVALQQSLEVYIRSVFPKQWAMSKINLGTVYFDRIRGERAENLEIAIAALQRSLEVYTRKAFPEQWAMTQNNLGSAYCDRIRGERAENLELAIASLQRSLEVRTREAFPEQWAMTQYNLGRSYQNLNQIPKAIKVFRLSLEIWTPTAFPIYCLMAGQNLGVTANRIKDWETAIEGYNLAIALT